MLRKRAVATMPASEENLPNMSPEEAGALVQELRTHQLELEMQNDELRRAQEELLETSNRYADLYDFAPVGYVTVSDTGLVLEANLTLSEMLNRERRTLVKSPFSQCIASDDQDIYYRHLKALLETKEKQTSELRLVSKGGEPFWVCLDSVWEKPANSSDTRFRVAINDISLRKNTEWALAAEKERLAVTLQSITDGVISVDTEDRIMLMNRVAELLTGWSESEATGKLLNEVFCVLDESTRKPYQNPHEKLFQDGGPVTLQTNTLLVDRNGAERVISHACAPVSPNSESSVGMVIVFRDIEARRRVRKELIRMQQLESLGTVAGGIAHDFNNSLTAILGNISLARASAEPEGHSDVALLEAEKAALRARNLTQQLLTFAKGGVPIKRTTEIRELVQTAIDFSLSGNNIKCHASIAADLWPVQVDRGQIHQALNNLIVNASQATAEGGIVRIGAENALGLPVSAQTSQSGNYVKISVSDTGHGIRPEDLGKIFEPYFTTRQGASGLGLATSYSIVKRHSGHISVESRLGDGTTFSIYFPASELKPLEREPSPGGLFPGKGRILVMDDEKMVRDVLGKMLNVLGYDVQYSEDGSGALEAYRHAMETGQHFDAVILDLTIPGGMGGCQAVQGLKEIDPQVTAIVSSGYATDPVVANYGAYGFAGVLPKPYKLEALSQVLYSLLPKSGRASSDGTFCELRH